MNNTSSHLDLIPVLEELLTRSRNLFNQQFVGLYLHGSLALGDFDPQHSDIDFLVITREDLPEDAISALEAFHEQLAAGSPRWGSDLEGSYIPLDAIRRHDPANAVHPHIERGGILRVEQHHSDWVLQRHIIRERGVVLAGPDPKALIDPVGPDELREAVLGLLWWWDLPLKDSTLLDQDAYQAYAALTMCRILYTLHHGAVVSKPVAARWALAGPAEPWRGLIERAMRHEVDRGTLDETKELIRFTLDRSRRLASV